MSDQPPPAYPVAQPLQYMSPQQNPYSGRKTGLLVFGIVFITAAVLFGLGTVASLGFMLAAPRQFGFRMPAYLVVQAVGTYAVLSIGLAWIGIDSIRAKRWVRPVVVPLAVLAVLGMVVGVGASLAGFNAATMSGPGASVALLMGLVVLLIMIGIPAASVWFYGSTKTRDALWFYDPHASWVEAVPMPVFAISMMTTIGAVSLVPALFMPANPVFGVLLRGPMVVVSTLVSAVLLLSIALLCYRLRMPGWWLALVLTLLGVVSNIANLTSGAMQQMTREMQEEMLAGMSANIQAAATLPASLPTSGPATLPAGFAQARLAQSIQDQADTQLLVQMISIVLFGLATVGYLLWVRKYFANGRSVSNPSPA
jgi:hypothetical protein